MAERLRVLQVVECGGPGGTGYQVAALCNGLDPGTFEVQLAYSVRPGTSPAEYEAMARGASRFHHVPEMVREISPLSDLRAFWKLYRLFRQTRPDLVHAHSSKAGFLARVAGWLARAPRIYYSPHGYAFLQTDSPPLKRTLYRWLEWSVSWIGKIIAVSYSEAALARGLTSRVHVVRDAYLGESPDERERGANPDVVFCTLGRMSYARNPEAFVRLARGLALARAKVRCVWIGAGELEPEVRRLAQSLRLEPVLELTGWLPHARALEALRRADVLVQFSRWEGLPNSVLEAMACGLPVLASDIPGNRELVRPDETGLLAPTEEDLLRQALILAGDPALRRRMGANGRDIVKRDFTRERLLREITAVYKQTAMSGSGK
ncbi:MAG: glycosyltransferase family 4 protein [Elusimicrobiota bacterium]